MSEVATNDPDELLDQLIPRPLPVWARIGISAALVAAAIALSIAWEFGIFQPQPQTNASGSTHVYTRDGVAYVRLEVSANSASRIEAAEIAAEIDGATVTDIGLGSPSSWSTNDPLDERAALPVAVVIGFSPDDCEDATSFGSRTRGRVETVVQAPDRWYPTFDAHHTIDLADVRSYEALTDADTAPSRGSNLNAVACYALGGVTE